MRVLLDNNVNQDFVQLIRGHELTHARTMGWGELANGDLITNAETASFDVLITADKQMQYQQSITGRRIAILVLNSRFIKWSHIAPLAPLVQQKLDSGVEPGASIVITPNDEGEQ